ncbi:MAG: hypothetical protein ABW035_00255 [Acidimicrobiales bacterium]
MNRFDRPTASWDYGEREHHHRPSDPPWEDLPADIRARAIVRAMVANFGECEVTEDDGKFVLSFRGGSGGRLIDEGPTRARGAYLTLRDPGPRTFDRNALPVYCAHCSVNNELQPLEWGCTPTSIEVPAEKPGDPCIHDVYKDVTAMPDEVYLRLGRTPPSSG